MSYAATSEEWRAWNARPTGPPADVRLVALTADRVHTYGALRTHHSQERFVAPMAVSYADALAPGKAGGSPATPWLRGIEADDVPVGFVMVAVAGPDRREPMLWRLLIDRHHQRRGVGRRAVDLLAAGCRDAGATELEVRWTDGPGGPRGFFERCGFVPIGEQVDGEVLARLPLR